MSKVSRQIGEVQTLIDRMQAGDPTARDELLRYACERLRRSVYMYTKATREVSVTVESPVFYRNVRAPMDRIVRGEGVYLYDDQGRRYLDGVGGTLADLATVEIDAAEACLRRKGNEGGAEFLDVSPAQAVLLLG